MACDYGSEGPNKTQILIGNPVIFIQEHERKHIGSKEDIEAKIEADTKVKIEAMNRSVASTKVTYSMS